MPSSNLLLRLPGRIHLSLLDMSGRGYRRHGGLGFSIEEGFTCEAALSRTMGLTDLRPSTPANSVQGGRLRELLNKVLELHPGMRPIHFMIISGFDAHQGFGSGTSLSLALVEALFILNEQVASEGQLARLSARGGVSGVGISGYFRGGVSLDLGVKNAQEASFFSSDEYEAVERAPLTFFRCDFPDWRIGLGIPPMGVFTSDVCERQFFDSYHIDDIRPVHELVYEVVMGVVPSLLEEDFSIFCRSVNNLQRCYWKASERKLHGLEIVELEKKLSSAGAHCVAMSSLGPGVVFFNQNDEQLEEIKTRYKIVFTKANNTGRSITYA